MALSAQIVPSPTSGRASQLAISARLRPGRQSRRSSLQPSPAHSPASQAVITALLDGSFVLAQTAAKASGDARITTPAHCSRGVSSTTRFGSNERAPAGGTPPSTLRHAPARWPVNARHRGPPRARPERTENMRWHQSGRTSTVLPSARPNSLSSATASMSRSPGRFDSRRRNWMAARRRPSVTDLDESGDITRAKPVVLGRVTITRFCRRWFDLARLPPSRCDRI